MDSDGDGVLPPTDCDDTDGSVHPGAEEICNGVDDDCNSWVDDQPADAVKWFADADGDGHGDPATSATGCDVPAGGVLVGDDCDDADASVYPGAEEACDLFDSDCDGFDGGECAPELTGEVDVTLAVASIEGESVGDGMGDLNGWGDIDGDGLPELWTVSPRKDDDDGNEFSAIDFFDLPASGSLVAGADSAAQRSGPPGGLTFGACARIDFDGDGGDDLVMGDADLFLEQGPILGFGSIIDSATTTMPGEAVSMTGLGCGGDLTGDGIDDVLVFATLLAADQYDNGGGAMVLSWPMGETVDAATVGRVLYWPDYSVGAGSFGAAVTDTDGDGIAEAYVGMTDHGSWTSRVAWFQHGPINSIEHLDNSDTTFSPDPDDTYDFGEPHDLGDLDGDGLGDFALSVSGRDWDTSAFIGVWVHSDPPAGSVDATTGWAHFYSRERSSALADPSVGDIDGDGVMDMIFYVMTDTCPNGDYSALYIAYGPIAGAIDVDELPDHICGVDDDDDGVGGGAAFLGDPDGDGFDDFVIGSSPPWREYAGKAWVFRGSPRGR